MHNYKKTPKKVKCPVCCNDNAQVLWGVSSEQAAQHFVLQEKYPERFSELVSHIQSLWGRDTCEVVECDKCGFCFSNPYISGDKKFYDLAYSRSGYPLQKWEFQLTNDVLKTLTKKNLRLLEIGAGNGSFIKQIAGKTVLKENILCTEFSEYGRRQIEILDVKCISQDIKNLSNTRWKESFDIVCAFQVPEHMDGLEVLFQKLNWLIKPGGSLFVAVPNQKIIEFNELNGALLDMPPNHIGRWNKKSFEVIGKQNGFRIKDYRIEKTNFTSMAKRFIISRLMRKSQQSGSLENRIFKIRNLFLLRIMQMTGVAVNSIIAIPALAEMNSGMGSSLWVHFSKDES